MSPAGAVARAHRDPHAHRDSREPSESLANPTTLR